MDLQEILHNLNDKQREVVSAPPSNILVLAGAGSGKTRVLVHRIAWLIEKERLSPYSILAVTFTNKAAAEMRNRIESLLGIPAKGMWVGTFHHLAHRLLRAHWQEANLTENFQIIDSDDQQRLIKRVIKGLGLDEKEWSPQQITWFINHKKDEGLRPQHIEADHDHTLETYRRIYAAYEETCQRSGLVDFAEILLRAHELWLNHPQVLSHYQQRFSQILVDEFQDTNTIQYAWLRLLASGNSHMMAVGDDDQSIYGWRGAKIENIQRFSRDYSATITIRLEQNYRSTGNILSAANALITHNAGRMGKNLWTSSRVGDPVSLYAGFNDIDEARFIVSKIQEWVAAGNRRDEVAILYRSNAQSRILEESLIMAQVPYRVYGGLRFFERAEIKDALAYLRLITNRQDDAAFERIVNTPTRGLGEQTLSVLRHEARSRQISLWQAARDVIANKGFAVRANNALVAFLKLIDGLDTDIQPLGLAEKFDQVIQASGLFAHHQKQKSEKAEMRIENLEELVNAARQYIPRQEESLPPLTAFLADAALEAGESQASQHDDCVQLMTLHAAKGLEFPLVFLSGLEEGLFPHRMSAEDPKRLEEERRLCYVGMTRAMQKLYLTYAEVRRMHGSENYHMPSRFIQEIPQEVIEAVRIKQSFSRPVSVAAAPPRNRLPSGTSQSGLRVGQTVHHPKFGEGTILTFEGAGEHERVQVKFRTQGTKWLVTSFAKLATV